MEAATREQRPPSDDALAESKPPVAIEKARAGEPVSAAEEQSALDYLLGRHDPLEFKVEAKIETARGEAPLTFVIRQMDGKRLDAIEEEHRSGQTGLVNTVAASIRVVAEGTVKLIDSSGRELDPRSEEFRTGEVIREGKPEPIVYADPALAFEARFRKQLGVLAGVAQQIRRVSGWSVDRVGTAERLLTEAAGN